MKLQFDRNKRVVALTNLIAMCERISGVCHTFKVVEQSSHRIIVEYSNPDEYGSNEPIRAHLPCYPISFADEGNCAVVLDPVRYTGCTGKNEESWQAFQQLWDCPGLYRSTPESTEWATEEEIKAKQKNSPIREKQAS